MSDAPEAQETEAVETESTEEPEKQAAATKTDGDTLPDDPDELKKYISKLRKENASQRVGRKEEAEAAKKWRAHLDAQKTELQKLQEQNEELTEKVKASETDALRKKLAKEHSVPDELVDLISGADEDEMTMKAKSLGDYAEKVKPKASASTMRAGRSGTPVKATKETAWLESFFGD